MIDPYEFDNANVDGDKEAVIVPNVPTLVNKLSANETNKIRDKLNEIIPQINTGIGPIQYLELRLKFKGPGNTLDTLQVGDIVHGFADASTIWTNARYEGGDINDRLNYTDLSGGGAPQTLDGFIGVTAGFAVGQTLFTLPAGAKVTDVYLSFSRQIPKTAVNAALVNLWEQVGDELTLTKIPTINQYLEIRYIS